MLITRSLNVSRIGLVALWTAFLVLAFAPAHAELTPGGKRVALVIGNGDYRAVDRLPNAANDARLIAETLRGLGFSIVGGGARLNLNREHLSDAVREFGTALAGAEVALFYYSGHGLQVKGVNWLVPVDASPSSERDLDFQMVDADLVLRQMDGIGTKLNIVLLDACRNNPFALRGLRSLQAGLAEMRAPEGTLISYATQPGNVAVDGAGLNSPYTQALASGMKQPGVDIFRLFNQVGLRVKKITDGRQQPWVSTSPIDGDFYFAGAPAVAASTDTVTAPPVTPPPVSAPPISTPPISTPSISTPPSSTPAISTPPIPTAANSAPVPPAITAMVAPPPHEPDPQSAVRSLVEGHGCSVLEARKEDDGLRLVGLTRGGPAWDDLLRQLTSTRSIRLGTPQVGFLPEFACAVLDVLSASIRETRLSEDRRLMLRAESTGGPISTVTLRRAGGAKGDGAEVRLDVFQADGKVTHLAVRRERPDGEDPRFSATLPSSSNSPRLVTAVASQLPINLGVRPASESSRAYLAVLRNALRDAPGPLRSEMVLLEAHPAAPGGDKPHVRPAAVGATIVARPAGRPARCGAILERAQLGEAVAESDRAFLQASCR